LAEEEGLIFPIPYELYLRREEKGEASSGIEKGTRHHFLKRNACARVYTEERGEKEGSNSLTFCPQGGGGRRGFCGL